MLKSFPIVKVIKKNWKVIALLLLLLVVALVILGLYPKIQEGASNPFVQTDATTNTATILAKGAKGDLTIVSLGLSNAAAHPVATIAQEGDKYKISNLLPNIRYNVNVKDASGNDYAGKIITLPDDKSITPPTFLSNDLQNTYSQLDATGNVVCCIKFDAGVDLPYEKTVGGDKSGFIITSFTITDPSKKTYPNKIITNPDTGEPGWCQVTGFNEPGKKYEIAVSSTTNLKGLLNTVYSSAFNKKGKPDTLVSSTSEKIIVYTAPVAVTNINCVISKTAPYKATVTFDTKNGSDTSYATSLNCKGSSMKEFKATVANGKGTIIIDNIPAGVNYPSIIINSMVNCNSTNSAPTDGTNDCSSVCNLTIPSNKKYKKKSTDNLNNIAEPSKSTFAVTTPK